MDRKKSLIRIRVVIALVIVSVLFLSIVYNKFEQSIFADKVESVELQMKNQISTVVSAYEADSKFLLKWAHSLSIEGTRRINWNSMAPYFAVAHLNANYQVVEWSFRENSPVSTLSKETLTQLVYSFQVNPQSTQISFQFYQDPEKKKILLTLVPVKEKLWVFASLGENLQSLMDNQKTLSTSLALVNKDLVSLAHVKPEYIGQKIFENAVIKDLKDNNKATSSGTYTLSNGEEFFAVIEKVPNMELYLYSQASLSEIIKNKQSFRRQFIFFSFGFMFILVGLSFLLIPRESDKPEMTARAESLKPVVAISAPPTEVRSSAAQVAKERIQSNMKIASALGHEMKAPLVKILSLVQLGSLSHSKDEVATTLEKVKAQARNANEIVEKLLLFAGEKPQNKINTKIDTPLLRAVKNMEPVFYQKVIKITKDLNATESFDMDVSQLVTVFENILKNSVQALDRKNNKEIKIKSYSEAGKVKVLIEDNGEGIAKEITEKIFDPFFTSMNGGQHLGLGLTVALGIVKQYNGNVIIDSERGQGTHVTVEFETEVMVSNNSKANINTNIKLATEETEDEIVIIDDIDPEDIIPKPAFPPPPTSPPKIVALNSDEEKTQGPSARPTYIKPIDLNIDVDELFEVSNEAPLSSQTNQNFPSPSFAAEVVKPKELSPFVKTVRASDEFKVTIRKPRRPV